MFYTFFSVLLGVYIGQEYDVPRVRNIYSNLVSFIEKYGNEFHKTYDKSSIDDNTKTTNDNYLRSSDESKNDTTNTSNTSKESSTWLYDMIKDNFSKKDN